MPSLFTIGSQIFRMIIAAHAVCLAAILFAAAVPAEAAEPDQALAGYRGWGAGPIEVSLIQRATPFRGFEVPEAQRDRMQPVDGSAQPEIAQPGPVVVPVRYVKPLS